MASIDRTAYPRLSKRLSERELATHYRLSGQELNFIRSSARGITGRLSLAALLKTRQYLNHFPALNEVPDQIRLHLIKQFRAKKKTPCIGVGGILLACGQELG